MSMLASAVEAVKVKVAQAKAGSDVAGQVIALYDEVMGSVRSRQTTVPEEFKHIPEIWAAQGTEDQLLTNADLLLDQLQADGRRAMLPEVKTTIIETVRDLKVRALEQDGVVNPLDSMAIKLLTGTLKQKARTYMMSARMADRAGKTGPGAALDSVEMRLLADIVREHGRNYEKFMRPAQAAVSVVAELRLQQLVR